MSGSSDHVACRLRCASAVACRDSASTTSGSGPPSGDLELRSDDFASAANRYEIAFGGGASNLELLRS